MAWRLGTGNARTPTGAEPFAQRLPISRWIARGNPLQLEKRNVRAVDAEVGRARGAVAGFHHQIADLGIPVAVGITKMRDRSAKEVLEFFLAR